MSGPEDRSHLPPDPPDDSAVPPLPSPLPPPPAPDAPTQVGIPVPAKLPPVSATPPPPASATPPPVFEPPPSTLGPPTLLIGLIGLTLALAVLGVILFGLILNASRPGTTPASSLPSASGHAVATGQTPAPIDSGPPATQATPPPGSSAPPASPIGTPATPQEALLRHVPPHLRAGCQLEPGEEPALAVASCQADDSRILATYFLYPDGDAMERAYGGFVQDSGIDRNSGRCVDPETWPSEGTYRVSGEPAGRVLCMMFSEAPTMYWTDTRLNILTWAFHFEGDTQRLFQFWRDEAGPAQ